LLANLADTYVEQGLHPMLRRFGIDMDELQVKVVERLPPFTAQSAIIIALVSFFVWFLVFVVIHYVFVMPFMSANKHREWVKPFLDLKPHQQRFYSSYIHGIIHAALSSFLAFVCFFYADGKPHTNWFNDNYYKLHCFDMQKHCMFVTVGYFAYDIIFCYFNTDSDGDQNASAW